MLVPYRGCQPVTEGLKLGSSSGAVNNCNAKATNGGASGIANGSSNGGANNSTAGSRKELRKAARKAEGDSPEARQRGMAALREAVAGHTS